MTKLGMLDCVWMEEGVLYPLQNEVKIIDKEPYWKWHKIKGSNS